MNIWFANASILIFLVMFAQSHRVHFLFENAWQECTQWQTPPIFSSEVKRGKPHCDRVILLRSFEYKMVSVEVFKRILYSPK